MTTGAAQSVRWSFVGLAAKMVAQIFASLVLARFLGPDLYGVVGLATVYVLLMSLLLDQGMGYALVRMSAPTRRDFGTVNCASVTLAIVLGGLTLLSAGALGAFFSSDELPGLLQVLALGLVLRGASVAPQARLLRDLRFSSIAKAEAFSSLTGAALGVGLAAMGAGKWSYAVQILVMDSLYLACMLGVAGASPWRGSLASLRSLLSFTANVSATQLTGFVARNADNLLIARMLGEAALAYYMIAYRIMRLPIASLVMVVNRALYPLFSRYREDEARLSRNFLTATRAMALAAVPLMALILGFAPEIIYVLFGPDWEQAIAPTQILSVAAMAQTLTSMLTPALLAVGLEAAQLRWTIASTVVMVSGFALTAPHGIVWVALAYTTVTLVFFPIAVAILRRRLRFSALQYLGALAPGVLVGTAAGLAGLALGRLLPDAAGVSVLLLLAAVCGAAAIGLAVGFLLAPKAVGEQLRLLRRVVNSR